MNYNAKLTIAIASGNNSLIYNLFTCDNNFFVWRHWMACHCDVINIKSFHLILRYLFQILGRPLRMKLEEVLFNLEFE